MVGSLEITSAVPLNVYFEKVENESSDLVGEGGGEPLVGEEGREDLQCSPGIRVFNRYLNFSGCLTFRRR